MTTGFRQYDFDKPSWMFVLEDCIRFTAGKLLPSERLCASIGVKGDENVLDFGCGGGILSYKLVKLLDKGGRVISVDTSEYWIKRAEKRLSGFSNAECLTGDIRNLKLPSDSFDIILINNVLHHVAPDIRNATVSALSHLLKPEGVLYISEPVKQSHGIPSVEIRSIMTGNGLIETIYQENGSRYTGKYSKNPLNQR